MKFFYDIFDVLVPQVVVKPTSTSTRKRKQINFLQVEPQKFQFLLEELSEKGKGVREQ